MTVPNADLDTFQGINTYLNGGVQRGGIPQQHDRDGLNGFGYQEQFDPNQLGRSGNPVVNTHLDNDHVDVIERNPLPGSGHQHHRVYDPGL